MRSGKNRKSNGSSGRTTKCGSPKYIFQRAGAAPNRAYGEMAARFLAPLFIPQGPMDLHYRNKPSLGPATARREAIDVLLKCAALAVAITVLAWAFAHYYGYYDP